MLGALPFIVGILSFWMLRESEKWKTAQTVPAGGQIKIGEHKTDLINGAIIFGSMLIGLWALFSWIPTWIQSLLHGSDGQYERGLGMMMLGAGGLSGGFASGWVANALGTKRAMQLCFSGCFILSFLLFRLNTTFTTVTLVEIAMLSFTFGISQGLLSVYIPQLFPVAIRATATGLCFNIGRFFTAAAVFFVGALVITLGGYGNSLFTFSFIFLLGFLILTLSKNITR